MALEGPRVVCKGVKYTSLVKLF